MVGPCKRPVRQRARRRLGALESCQEVMQYFFVVFCLAWTKFTSSAWDLPSITLPKGHLCECQDDARNLSTYRRELLCVVADCMAALGRCVGRFFCATSPADARCQSLGRGTRTLTTAEAAHELVPPVLPHQRQDQDEGDGAQPDWLGARRACGQGI